MFKIFILMLLISFFLNVTLVTAKDKTHSLLFMLLLLPGIHFFLLLSYMYYYYSKNSTFFVKQKETLLQMQKGFENILKGVGALLSPAKDTARPLYPHYSGACSPTFTFLARSLPPDLLVFRK